MVVSSDDVFRAVAACALTEAGFMVLVAANSMSAIAAMPDRGIDGLITTIGMPRGHPNGPALARLVRDLNSMSTVIFLTEDTASSSTEPLVGDGGPAILCPPGDVPGLISRMRTGIRLTSTEFGGGA